MYSYLPKIGGAQVSAHSLANSLAGQGHRVFVYADANLLKQCRNLGWRFHYETRGFGSIPFRLAGRGGTIGTCIGASWLSLAVKLDRLDIVQLIGMWPWALVSPSVQSATGIPFALRAAGDDIQVDHGLHYGVGRNHRARSKISKAIAKADLGIAISNTVTDEFTALGMDRNRITVIPPGVDFSAFQRQDYDGHTIKERWGLPLDRTLILSVGRYHIKKGFEDLVNALAILNHREDKFALAIVGRDSTRLVDTAKNTGVGESFFPLPVVASEPESSGGTFPSRDLIDLYRAADHFILPSYLETYANVALESMAAGTPVIVTDVPGCRDTVVDGADGLIVPSNSPDAIAAAIERIGYDSPLRSRLVRGGLEKASAQDWSSIAKLYAAEYHRLHKKSRQNKPH